MIRTLFAATALVAASLASADPKAEVFAAWDAMVAAKSYRAELETTAAGQTFKETIEVIIPDHFRMYGGPSGEMILTPEGAWIKFPGQDAWMPAPPGTTQIARQFMSPEFIEQAKAGVRSVKALGTERVGDTEARVYQVEQVMTVMGIESKTSSRLYVDIASGRPIRQEIESEAMGQRSSTRQEIRYVADLQIVAPK
jgi:hypothetical protein